jgi:hypothetical protein
MTITITVTQDKPQPSPTIRRLKRWAEDTGMIADNYSVFVRLVDGVPIGQFSHIQLYMLDGLGDWIGSWSSNDIFSSLTPNDLTRIAAMQITDGYTLAQKMNWLMYGGSGQWGGVMQAVYPTSARWMEAVNIKQIGAAYANNNVTILDTRTFVNVPYNGKEGAAVPMSRIKTGWDVIHEVTCVSKNDVTMSTPVGKVYLPLITKTDSVWVMNRWLA